METEKTNFITTIKTEKFKTILIKISFKAKLARETITARTLLASVLRNSSQQFTSKKQLNGHLENLYGATLSNTAKKQGAAHVVSFYLQIANDKFLKSSPLLFVDALKVLASVILNPRIKNNSFNTEVVALEKRLLKEDIESIYDDKTTYALKEMVAKMCEFENFGVNGDGYICDLNNINEKTLVDTYDSMINEDEISISVLGDVNHEEVTQLIQNHFNVKSNMRSVLKLVDHEEKEISSVAILEEEQLVNQTKLNIGYRTYTRVTEEDYFAMLVMNGVFGAFAHSKLFMNVREKESLCYYCTSQLDNFKGLMYVYCGLDAVALKKAMNIIDQQLQAMIAGDFTDQELMMAKKSIINIKRESLDSASGMLSDLEMQLLLGITTDEFISKIESITKDDTQRVAKKIKKDTVFTLVPQEVAG